MSSQSLDFSGGGVALKSSGGGGGGGGHGGGGGGGLLPAGVRLSYTSRGDRQYFTPNEMRFRSLPEVCGYTYYGASRCALPATLLSGCNPTPPALSSAPFPEKSGQDHMHIRLCPAPAPDIPTQQAGHFYYSYLLHHLPKR